MPTITTQPMLRIDYTNHSAQVIDPQGNCVAIYSHVHGRAAAIVRIAREGWLLTPEASWAYTWPPDGRQHPLVHRPRPESPVLDPMPLDPNASPDTVATQIVSHFGPGTWVIGVTTDDPHATVHRADLALPYTPHCGTASHGVPATMAKAIGVLDTHEPHAVITLLTALAVDTCRACQRCWRPAWSSPPTTAPFASANG
jgi:hypothetical protein